MGYMQARDSDYSSVDQLIERVIARIEAAVSEEQWDQFGIAAEEYLQRLEDSVVASFGRGWSQC